MNRNNNMINTIMQMMNSNTNPQQIIQNIVAQNPQANAIINQVKQSGMTPQQFLNQYAKQNNIDLNNNPMVQMLRSKGIKF